MRRRLSFGGLALFGAVLGASLLLAMSASGRVERGVSGKVRAALLSDALSYAWSHKADEAAEVEAVRTTLGAAGHVKSSASRPNNTPVYVVALEAILIPHCLVPHGERAPKCVEAFELEFRASSLKLMRAHDSGGGSEAYPDLSRLGAPVLLSPPREPIRRPK